MRTLCVLCDAIPAEPIATAIAALAPRAALDPPRIWLDVRGLDATAVIAAVRRLDDAPPVRFGLADVPVAAALAAASAAPGELRRVTPGGEAAFLAPLPLTLLFASRPGSWSAAEMLADVGIRTCGELAAVPREALEVRFGGAAVEWWRLARGVDGRRLFRPPPASAPGASVDFVDYVVTDPERLLFTANALIGGLCEQLLERGEQARRLRLRLPLANGAVWERTLRSARPTADRAAWLRLARNVLERITVPDSVAGVAVEVESTTEAHTPQGDLFDAGFATASAVESAVARLLEDQGGVIRAPEPTEHPLPEARGTFRALTLREALNPGDVGAATAVLTLQLLPEPLPLQVETVARRDHEIPVRCRLQRPRRSLAVLGDGAWHELQDAAGPDRVSGGHGEEGWSREYFRAVTDSGSLVWVYRDRRGGAWFFHGWWD